MIRIINSRFSPQNELHFFEVFKLSVRFIRFRSSYRWTKSQYWSDHRHECGQNNLPKFHDLSGQCAQCVSHRLKVCCKRWRLPGSMCEYSSLHFYQRSNPSWRWTTPFLPDFSHNQEQRARSFWVKCNFSSLQYDSKWSFLRDSSVSLLYMQLHWFMLNSHSTVLHMIFHCFGYSLYSFDIPYFDLNHFIFHV